MAHLVTHAHMCLRFIESSHVQYLGPVKWTNIDKVKKTDVRKILNYVN